MNKIERAYLEGFLKSAGGFGIEGLVTKAMTGAGDLEKAEMPVAKQMAEVPVDPEQLENARRSYESITTGNKPEYNAINPSTSIIPHPTLFGKNTQQSIWDKLKPNNIRSTINNNPVQAVAGTVAAGVPIAHYGGQELGALTGPSPENILRDPQHTQEVLDGAHQGPDIVSSLYSKLKDSVSNHKLLYGGGALGLGALGASHYLHEHNKHKQHSSVPEQPGMPEDVTL